MAIVASLATAPAALVTAQDQVKVFWNDQIHTGRILFSSSSDTILLARDGQIHHLPGTSKTETVPVKVHFEPESLADMRQQLRREFGPQPEISFTGHYTIVHPSGQAELWKTKFEDFYGCFQQYFSQRNIELSEPEFKLVAIVFNSRGEFLDYARRMGDRLTPRMVSYYSPKTNRIAILGGGEATSSLTTQEVVNPTILHEVTHQAAFNRGIHHRCCPPPLWISEGLSTLLESQDKRSTCSPSYKDRINPRMLEAFAAKMKTEQSQFDLEGLISNDDLFQDDPVLAYASAWLISFYLSEEYPNEYEQLLRTTFRKIPFRRITCQERRDDWEAIFKEPPHLFEERILDFYDHLKSPVSSLAWKSKAQRVEGKVRQESH